MMKFWCKNKRYCMGIAIFFIVPSSISRRHHSVWLATRSRLRWLALYRAMYSYCSFSLCYHFAANVGTGALSTLLEHEIKKLIIYIDPDMIIVSSYATSMQKWVISKAHRSGASSGGWRARCAAAGRRHRRAARRDRAHTAALARRLLPGIPLEKIYDIQSSNCSMCSWNIDRFLKKIYWSMIIASFDNVLSTSGFVEIKDQPQTAHLQNGMCRSAACWLKLRPQHGQCT